MKKIENMESKREEYEKIKNEQILQKKKLREERYCSCLKNRKKLQMELSERRLDILFYQNLVLNRSLSRDSLFSQKNQNANEKTVFNQINLEKNLTIFNKKMNLLKSQSVTKMTTKEKMKLFKEIKRQEAEKKKDEEDKKSF